MGRAPIIAMTGRSLAHDRITSWSKDAFALPQAYARAIAQVGGLPAVVPPIGDPTAWRYDALLLAGGGDVDPAIYAEDRHPACYGVDRALDDFEVAIVSHALAEGRPVLAICRGLQVLNVTLGGTLRQHITDQPGLGRHGDPAHGGGVLHHVAVEPGSRVAKAMGVDAAVVHSHHHQAVDALASGCTATAWTDDGIVEAFEVDGHPWAVAVQWHPEMTFEDDPTQLALFDAFVDVAMGV